MIKNKAMEKHFKSPVGRSETLTKAEAGGSKDTTKNAFLDASTSHDTFTENMAVSHSSTGNAMLDDFSNSGAFRGRSTDDVFASASKLYAINPAMALKLFLYLRLITRKVKGWFNTESVQRGQGNKDESLRRLLWVAYNHPEAFYKNLWLIPLVGSFKDLWTLMAMDFKDELDRGQFYSLMTRAFSDQDLSALAIKYMPQIRAKGKLKTDRARILNALAKEFARFMNLTYKEYREFKSSNGEAHRWQQEISKGYFHNIDFGKIPGKALSQLVSSKFLTNRGLVEKYTQWIESQPVAKFTGYVYELMKKVKTSNSNYQIMTINKQFDGLLKLAEQDEGGIQGNVWTAIDTSGSMEWAVTDDGTRAYDVAVSLGIYFSSLNKGAFKDHVIMFDHTSRKMELAGTFTDKVQQIRSASIAWGDTNFQSVIDEIARIRTYNPDIPVEDYPQTLLVVSDMQFNPSGRMMQTNYETAMSKLKEVGLPEITIIWWQVTGRTEDVPSRADDKGTVLISGFDGAVISLILGGQAKKPPSEITPEDAMREALSQEILEQVTV